MPFFKVVYIFNSGRNGWTETWYMNKSNIQAVEIPAKNVAAYRAGLCAKYATIEAIRVVSEDKPRIHFVVPTNYVVGSGVGSADTPWNAIQVAVTSDDNLYQRTQILRGVDDEWIKRGIDGNIPITNNGDLKPPLEAFKASARANGLLFKARAKSGEGGIERDATIWSKDAAGHLQCALVGGTYGPGAQITFSGVTGPGASQFIKGTHKVRSYAANLLTLETTVPGDVDPTTWTNGKGRAFIPFYPIAYYFEPLRPMKRSTGRAFFVTRGRRSK